KNRPGWLVLLHDAGAACRAELLTEFGGVVAAVGTDLDHIERAPAAAEIALGLHEGLAASEHRGVARLDPRELGERLGLGEGRREMHAPWAPGPACGQGLGLVDRAHHERGE